MTSMSQTDIRNRVISLTEAIRLIESVKNRDSEFGLELQWLGKSLAKSIQEQQDAMVREYLARKGTQ